MLQQGRRSRPDSWPQAIGHQLHDIVKLPLAKLVEVGGRRRMGQQLLEKDPQFCPSFGAPHSRKQKAVGQADLVDGEPGVALQVQRLSQVDLEVAVRAGYPLAAVHVDRGHPFSKEAARSGCDGGAAGDVLASSVDQRGAGEQLLAQEAERRSHRRLFPMRSALRRRQQTWCCLPSFRTP